MFESFRVGDWDLRELVAEGGQGKVFRAKHRTSEALAAFKMIDMGLDRDRRDELRRRLEREVRALERSEHPAVVAVLDHGESPSSSPLSLGYVWIAYEFVDGPTLQQWVDAHRPTPTEVAMLTLPLAQGLDHVHSIDVLHRDIKPSNVILRMAQCGAPVLIDFSYAKPVGRSGLTSSRRAVGTEHYMAPEVLTHPVACSTRSDQWSLAKVVAEVIARALGTPADGLFLMRPAELVDLIRRELPDAAAALQRAFGPADTRYPTAEALATDIGLSCLGADRRAQVGPRPVPSHSRSARQLDATHSGTVPSEVFRVRARHNGRFLGMGSATVLDARRLRSDDSARSTMVRRCIVKIGTRSFDGVVYEASLKSRFTKGRGSAVYSTDGRRKLCTIYRADR